MDLARQLAVIDDAGRRIAAAAAHPRQPVPSCPGWSVGDLVWHAGVVQMFWRQLVDGTIASPASFTPGDRPADDGLEAWYRSGLGALASVLAAAEPSQPAWSWSDDKTAGFIQRRMAHELTVHAWDAEAALGRAHPVDADVAVDGVDELFDAFLFRVSVPVSFAAGAALHLHATAPADGEWLVHADGDRWLVEHRHAKGACALQGPPSDLLLALWGRVPVAELTTFGDVALFTELLDGLRASMGGPRQA